MFFGAMGTPVRNLCNLANPSGLAGETSTLWVIEDCVFQGLGVSDYTLNLDFNEDTVVRSCVIVAGRMSWNVLRGGGYFDHSEFTGVPSSIPNARPPELVCQGLQMGFVGTKMPFIVRLTGSPGAESTYSLQHCFFQRSPPRDPKFYPQGAPNFINDSPKPVRLLADSSWIYGANGQPIFGGAQRWHVKLVNCVLLSIDGTTTPLMVAGAGSTVDADSLTQFLPTVPH
jgi:hypothetical protein